MEFMMIAKESLNEWRVSQQGIDFLIVQERTYVYVPYWNEGGLWENEYEWFTTYKSARNYLKCNKDLKRRLVKGKIG